MACTRAHSAAAASDGASSCASTVTVRRSNSRTEASGGSNAAARREKTSSGTRSVPKRRALRENANSAAARTNSCTYAAPPEHASAVTHTPCRVSAAGVAQQTHASARTRRTCSGKHEELAAHAGQVGCVVGNQQQRRCVGGALGSQVRVQLRQRFNARRLEPCAHNACECVPQRCTRVAVVRESACLPARGIEGCFGSRAKSGALQRVKAHAHALPTRHSGQVRGERSAESALACPRQATHCQQAARRASAVVHARSHYIAFMPQKRRAAAAINSSARGASALSRRTGKMRRRSHLCAPVRSLSSAPPRALLSSAAVAPAGRTLSVAFPLQGGHTRGRAQNGAPSAGQPLVRRPAAQRRPASGACGAQSVSARKPCMAAVAGAWSATPTAHLCKGFWPACPLLA